MIILLLILGFMSRFNQIENKEILDCINTHVVANYTNPKIESIEWVATIEAYEVILEDPYLIYFDNQGDYLWRIVDNSK